jgi:hypothetical protein
MLRPAVTDLDRTDERQLRLDGARTGPPGRSARLILTAANRGGERRLTLSWNGHTLTAELAIFPQEIIPVSRLKDRLIPV